jgi:transcriptional regulator with XRE-family HTH domain
MPLLQIIVKFELIYTIKLRFSTDFKEMKSKLRHILAINIKNRRHLLGLSQAKLAERAGIAGYLATIELEKSFPSDDVLERIASALKIDPSELFSKNGHSIEAIRTFQNSILEEFDKTLKIQIAKFQAKK